MNKSSETTDFNETQFLQCLEKLESGKGVVRALIEITLMRIPSRQKQKVLQSIEKYKEKPTTKRYCRIITNRLVNGSSTASKYRPKKNSNETRCKTVRFASASDNDVVCLDESADSHDYSPNKVKILSELKRGVYYRKSDEISPISTPTIDTDKVPVNQEVKRKDSVPSTSSNSGSGLQYSGSQSAFRPIISRKRSFPTANIRLQDIQKTPYYQKIYKQVVEETRAQEKSTNSSLDYFLEEMTQINYPHFAFRCFTSF